MYEIKMPQLGQSVEEAAIVEWLKKEGDPVKEGEPICTVQTDKAAIEVECTASGVLRKILLDPDVNVPVLTVIALVGEPGELLPDLASYGTTGPSTAVPEAEPVVAEPVAVSAAVGAAPSETGRALVSPRARARAAELGVDPTVIAGTGPQGRVLEADVEAYAAKGVVKASPTAKRLAANLGVDVAGVSGTGPGGRVMKEDVQKAAKPAAPAATQGKAAVTPQGKRIPLTPMRSIIARRMSESKFMAPHYYVTVEVDMSVSAKAFRSGGLPFKPSYNDLVLAATVKALREYPGVNATWAGDAIVEVGDINLGVAVALPTGLIVPVLKQAQHLSLEGIHLKSRELSEKARTGKLLPDDYIGNTFTVSNLGAYGVDHFTAIINQPDSAILAVGQIKDRPVVIDGGIYIRPIMKLTVSSDHRVVDGALAAQFAGRLKEILETADL